MAEAKKIINKELLIVMINRCCSY